MNLVVRPIAAADIEDIYLWYDAQRDGLGNEFLDAVKLVFEALLGNPRLFRVVHRDTRRANIRRFPYSVFYRVIGDTVVIVGCFHGSRNPRGWESRR